MAPTPAPTASASARRAPSCHHAELGSMMPAAAYLGTAVLPLGTGRKAIACATHGLHEVVTTVRLEGASQAPNVHIDGTLLDVHIAAPDAVEQLLTTVDPLGMGHKEFEQA